MQIDKVRQDINRRAPNRSPNRRHNLLRQPNPTNNTIRDQPSPFLHSPTTQLPSTNSRPIKRQAQTSTRPIITRPTTARTHFMQVQGYTQMTTANSTNTFSISRQSQVKCSIRYKHLNSRDLTIPRFRIPAVTSLARQHFRQYQNARPNINTQPIRTRHRETDRMTSLPKIQQTIRVPNSPRTETSQVYTYDSTSTYHRANPAAATLVPKI